MMNPSLCEGNKSSFCLHTVLLILHASVDIRKERKMSLPPHVRMYQTGFFEQKCKRVNSNYQAKHSQRERGK